MKTTTLLIIFIAIGCIVLAGYMTKSTPAPIVAKPEDPNAVPPNNSVLSNLTTTSPVTGNSPNAVTGQLLLSIGKYNAQLPVFIDNIQSGTVSNDGPLLLTLDEGSHHIRICSGSVCENTDVEIKSSVKTSIDFGDRLQKDVPSGSLSISIGDYPAILPVVIDNATAGNISQGQLFNRTLVPGIHTVSVCANETCFSETIEIKATTPTTLDLGEWLKNKIRQGPLEVTIGGYNAEIPVLIDDVSVGNVSRSKPILNLMVNEGNHTVKVCIGKVCEKEDVQIQFAKPVIVDFGDQLKNDVEFTTPTVRIIKTFLSGDTLVVDAQFINPDDSDHTITATISCIYTYTDDHNVRVGDSAKTDIESDVASGERIVQRISLYLPGGLNVIPGNPVVSDIIVK